MNAFLSWLRSNIATVVFVVVMVAAAAVMPFVARKMNAAVRKDADERARRYGEMTKFEKTAVTLPDGRSESLLINQKFLDEYRVAVEQAGEDADQVFEAAIAHNRKDRGVLLPELFPKPPPNRQDVLPQNFYEALLDAYTRLLAEVGAGGPPEPTQVAAQLHRQEQQFLTNLVAKTSKDELSPEQLGELKQRLSQARTFIYLQNASTIKFYADLADFGIPDWTPALTLDDLFEMQWQYWIHEDLLRALADANRDARSVVQAPVKHLLDAAVEPRSAMVDPAASGGGGGGAGFGPGGGRRGGAPDGGSAAVAPPLNPRQPVPQDFTLTLTGRRSNPLYDVRYVNVSLIVDPVRAPEILDALARRNFISVVGLTMTPADAFAGLERGFFYTDSGALARLDLRLETIWLRPWTKAFMPEETRAMLGVPPDPPAPQAG